MKAPGAGKPQVMLHALGIILFLTLPALFAPHPAGEPFFNFSKPTQRDLISNLIMLAFFYTNYYFLIPQLYLRKKHSLYWILVALALGLVIFLPSLITGFVPWGGTPPPHFEGPLPSFGSRPIDSSFILSINHNIFLFACVVMFSILLRVRDRLHETEKAKNQMEILSLKEQINPHFLFNTLNNIYGQAIEDNSHQTASSILKLSAMLRHVVHDAQYQWVTINKELAYLENYIQLQRQRLGDGVELTYLTRGSFSESLKIAPLILIPFIENAFKHGINPDERSLIKIDITVSGNELSLLVENKKTNGRLQAHEKSGAGMKITMERLGMLYPKKHDLHIEDTSDHYVVNLKLELCD